MVTREHLISLLDTYTVNPTANQGQQIVETAIKLTAQNCSTAIDIGCGQNWLKHLITCTTTGVDAGGVSANWRDSDRSLHTTKADVIASLGDEWFVTHQAQFDCAFALSSIHYRTFDEIVPAIVQVMQMCVKQAYISMNSRRILDHAYQHFAKTGNKDKINSNKKFLNALESDTHNFQQNFLNWLCCNIDYHVDHMWLMTHDGKDSGNQGDIHMVLSH